MVGNSGSGKTTLAAELGRQIAAPHLELDSVFQQPGWHSSAQAEPANAHLTFIRLRGDDEVAELIGRAWRD